MQRRKRARRRARRSNFNNLNLDFHRCEYMHLRSKAVEKCTTADHMWGTVPPPWKLCDTLFPVLNHTTQDQDTGADHKNVGGQSDNVQKGPIMINSHILT